MSHTEGKLKFDGHYILDENGGAVGIFGGTDPENPRRLVACWNALLPVETEWLEQYNTNPVIDSVFTENAKLRQERDELVKRHNGMIEALRTFSEEMGWVDKDEIEAIISEYPEQS